MYDEGDHGRGEPGELHRPQPANPQQYARSHPLRLAILALLASKRHPERSVGALSAELPDSPASVVVEYHLRVLRNVGLVGKRDTGSNAIYSLA